MAAPKPLSQGEEEFVLHCSAHGLLPEREFQFEEGRKWRFDFAFRAHRIAVEIEGGTWTGGRHTRGDGFARDCAKYNHAAILGYRVLRFTGAMVTSGEAIDTTLRAIEAASVGRCNGIARTEAKLEGRDGERGMQ